MRTVELDPTTWRVGEHQLNGKRCAVGQADYTDHGDGCWAGDKSKYGTISKWLRGDVPEDHYSPITKELTLINDRAKACDQDLVNKLNASLIFHGAPFRYKLKEGDTTHAAIG